MPSTSSNANTVVIVADTREQKPYEFDNPGLEVLHKALPAGDYSLAGYEDQVAVERKTLDDFAKTVIRGRERFKRELLRLQGYKAACVVVEADMCDIFKRKYRSRAHPASIFGSLVSIVVDYNIPVYFCSTRQLARYFTEKFLLRFKRMIES